MLILWIWFILKKAQITCVHFSKIKVDPFFWVVCLISIEMDNKHGELDTISKYNAKIGYNFQSSLSLMVGFIYVKNINCVVWVANRTEG